jgi:predicted ester cyclase
MNSLAEARLREGAMSRSDHTRIGRPIVILGGLAVLSLLTSCAPPEDTSGREDDVPQPASITIDDSVSAPRARRAVRAAQLYYAFWDTGRPEYARIAVGPGFVDNTVPEGSRQGPEGLEAASRVVRTAVPDLRCAIEHLLVSGDQVVARLTFRGTQKGAFVGHPATGTSLEFKAIDMLQVQGGRIVECRHVEDNYNSTLMRQVGAAPLAGRCQEKP